MRRALRLIVVVTGALTALGGAAFTVAFSGAPTGEATARLGTGDAAHTEPRASEPPAFDLRRDGRWRQVTVHEADGAPAVHVQLTMVESSSLVGGEEPHHFISCDDRQHLTEVAAALRAGSSVQRPLLTVTTDEHGRVLVPEGLPGTVLVQVERAGERSEVLVLHRSMTDLALPEPAPAHRLELRLVDGDGRPPRGARLTILELASNLVTVAVPAPDGTLVLEGRGQRWAIAEAVDAFPEPLQLEALGEHADVVLRRAGLVEVSAPAAGAELEVQLAKRHPRPRRLHGGRALFDGERAGPVTAEVVTPGARGRASGVLGEGASLLLELSAVRVGVLLVTVVDEQGAPVPLARASFRQHEGVTEVVASEDGQRLVLPVAGEGQLAVWAPGFRTQRRPLTVGLGETDVEVVLARSGLIVGKVRDAAGNAVPFASVSARAVVTNELVAGSSDGEGHFVLHVDDPGGWLVEASSGTELTRSPLVSAGAEVALRLEPAGRVAVTVFGADGSPLPGVRVAKHDGIVEVDSALTDEQGVGRFTLVLPGPARFEVADGRAATEVNVLGGHQVDVAVRLPAN